VRRTVLLSLLSMALAATSAWSQGTGKATSSPAGGAGKAPAAPAATATPAAPANLPSSAPAATAAGAAASAPSAATDGPKPAAELAKLQFLVGDWVHEEVIDPSGSGGKGAARSKNAWILGDHHLYLIYKSNSTKGVFEGRGFLGWDANTKAYRLAWFDSTGLAQVYTGNFDPEEALILSGEYMVGPDKVRERLTIKKQPGGKFLLTDETATGDAPMKVSLESMASPAPPPPAAPAAPAAPATAPAPTAPAPQPAPTK
jgi:hypothetical protein